MWGRMTVLSVAAALLLSIVSPAAAITWGQPDAGNWYANVGVIMIFWPDAEDPDGGEWQPFCSGTLIDPYIFLTAGHVSSNLEYLVATGSIGGISVNFNPDALDLGEGESALHEVLRVETHPDFAWSPASDRHDVGVLIFAQAVEGITPATVAPTGLLDELKKNNILKKQPYFAVVGYGGTLSWPPSSPEPRWTFDWQRQFAMSEYLALRPAWLQLSQNQAAGDGGSGPYDSGGPTFWTNPDTGETVLVALVSWGDMQCVATGTNYRVDIPGTDRFLDDMFETYGE